MPLIESSIKLSQRVQRLFLAKYDHTIVNLKNTIKFHIYKLSLPNVIEWYLNREKRIVPSENAFIFIEVKPSRKFLEFLTSFTVRREEDLCLQRPREYVLYSLVQRRRRREKGTTLKTRSIVERSRDDRRTVSFTIVASVLALIWR